MTRRRTCALGIAVALVWAGCGGEVAPEAEGTQGPARFAPAATGVDRPPVVESVRIEPAEPAVGATVRAVVAARDPDGERVRLGHRWFVDGRELRWDEASLALDDVRKGAEIRVVVTASDGKRESEPVAATATVIDRPPTITRAWLSPEAAVPPGQPVTVQASTVDPDGDPVELDYAWYVNGERRLEATGALFDTEGLRRGDTIRAEVRASDGTTWTRPERTAVVTVGSGHPEITSTPPGFREDGVFRYAVEARDPDGDKRLRFALEEGPEGMAIDSLLGELIWRPRGDQVGVHPVSVVVRDSTGLETKQSFHVTVREGAESTPAAAAP